MNTLTMKWLLRREFWEHKGAMFWAPAIVAALLVLLVGGTMIYGLAAHGVPNTVHINGRLVTHDALSAALPPEMQSKVTRLASAMYLLGGLPLFIVMAGVMFFYCLGALYDERKDRSILFWKSLPVSDATTVLSKVITALCVAPLIVLVLDVIASLALLLIGTLGLSLNGIHLIGALLSQPDLYLQPLRLLALLPVYAVWALPTIGWLLLVSSWARTKPFLWAVGVPLIVLLLVRWISYTLENFSGVPLNIMPAAQEVVARLLTGVVPGIWFAFTEGIPAAIRESARDQGPDMGALFEASWMTLLTVQAWVGALAGAAMIFAAMRLRRWRDEG
jgi:ABC-2 type transport system permease protein